MTLSKQMSSAREMVALKKYATRAGWRITESLPESTVHKVHVVGSWHYLKNYYAGKWRSKAADFNFGPAGKPASEKTMGRLLVQVGLSMGIAMRFSLTGHVSGHDDHVHADQGAWTNTGGGEYHQKAGDLCAWDVQLPLKITQDNLAGAITRKNLFAVREAVYGRFPYGVKFTQKLVGTTADGIWGPKSKAALKSMIRKLQTVWKTYRLYSGKIDGIWGSKTGAAYTAFIKKYGR